MHRDASWILTTRNELSWCTGFMNHQEYLDYKNEWHLICYQIARLGSWEVFNPTNLDISSARLFSDCDIDILVSMNYDYVLLYFRSIWEHARIIKGDFGDSWGVHGPFWRYPLTKLEHSSRCLRWQLSANIGWIDAESMLGHYASIGIKLYFQVPWGFK